MISKCVTQLQQSGQYDIGINVDKQINRTRYRAPKQTYTYIWSIDFDERAKAIQQRKKYVLQQMVPEQFNIQKYNKINIQNAKK